MAIFLFTFSAFLFLGIALAIGLLLGGKAIEGSCGGLNRIPGLEDSCGACTKKRCPRKHNDRKRM